MDSTTRNAQVSNWRTGLVVEDSDDTRRWLVELMHFAFPAIEVEAAANFAQGLQASQRLRPDVVLVDLGLPDGNGADLIREIRDEVPKAICIVATVFDDERHLFPALRAGAHGYILKDQKRDELAALLRGIEQGQAILSPAIARRLIEYFHTQTAEDDHMTLSPREEEVLGLIARGYTNVKVGDILDISRHTVAGYVKEIYRKLAISTRSEAALVAARRGLIGRDCE